MEVRMNLEQWKPTPEEAQRAIKDIEAYHESLIEIEEFEQAQEVKDDLEIIKDTDVDMDKFKQIVGGYYADKFWAVPVGTMTKYYGKEEAEFIERVLGVEYEEVSEEDLVKEYFRKHVQLRMRGTETGGFKITLEVDDQTFEYPQEMLLEEAMSCVMETVKDFGLDFDRQVHIPVFDIFHSKDNSIGIQKVRELVKRNPEVLATMERKGG